MDRKMEKRLKEFRELLESDELFDLTFETFSKIIEKIKSEEDGLFGDSESIKNSYLRALKSHGSSFLNSKVKGITGYIFDSYLDCREKDRIYYEMALLASIYNLLSEIRSNYRKTTKSKRDFSKRNAFLDVRNILEGRYWSLLGGI